MPDYEIMVEVAILLDLNISRVGRKDSGSSELAMFADSYCSGQAISPGRA
jgi:hypothetical protein